MSSGQTQKYPLGTDPIELERLQLQHRLWSDAAHALWRLAKIQPGSRVLDVGCGPGAASVDLAQLVTSNGHLLAVDESKSFIDFLADHSKERGLSHVVTAVGDVQDLAAVSALQRASYDAAYARWVLCFTPKPEAVLAGVAHALKPGGVICIHDYFNYHIMTPAPRRASYTQVVNATAKSWRDNGGDPDIVGRLPGLLFDAGFDVEHLAVHQRLARPGDTMWHWAATWWRSYTPKLVAMGYLTEEDRALFHREMDAMTFDRDFLVLPPVFEVMARKRA